MSCPPGSDQVFGPQVHQSCRSFDFTLQFEDVIFQCVPAAVFLPLALVQTALIINTKKASLYPSDLYLAAKVGSLTVAFILQLAFLGVRAQRPELATNASLAGDVLTCVATLTAMALSLVSHWRSSRPSTLLALYLSAMMFISAARIRTMWLITGSSAASATVTASTAFLLSTLFFESLSKQPLTANTAGKHKVLERNSALWARVTFSWLAATFRLGYTNVISNSDLPDLDSKLHSARLSKQLSAVWKESSRTNKYSLVLVCFRTFPLSFASTAIPRLCITAFTFTQPFLINTTLLYISQDPRERDSGRGLIGAWLLVYLGIAISEAIYGYQKLRFTTRIRGSLIALVSEYTMATRSADVGKITGVSLMSTDIERIVDAMRTFNEVWGSFIDIAIACWLLERQLSLACLAPILLILVFITASGKVSATAGPAQKNWVEKVQERLRVTTLALDEMKSVKLLGLSGLISSLIHNLRLNEIQASRAFRKIIVATIVLSLTPINLAPVVTFAVYIIISVYWKNTTLLTAQAFTSIAVIILLTTPVIVFIQSLPNVLKSIGSFERIQEYCKYSESTLPHGSQTASTHSQPASRNEKAAGVELTDLSAKHEPLAPQTAPSTSVTCLKGENFSWTRTSDPVLKNVTVTIVTNAFNAIVGPTASGKSALLLALLGEMVSSGPSQDHRFSDTMAYCAQSPWLENRTVRENILGVSSYDHAWYQKVLWACCLQRDLAQLDKKDNTKMGTRGLNLSGGQKHRIALARAIYSRQKTLVLDDIFSSLDATTSSTIARRLFGPSGLLPLHGITTIMATNNPKLMAYADNVIVIEDGTISQMGQLQTILAQDGYMAQFKLPSMPNSDDHADADPEEATATEDSSTEAEIESDIKSSMSVADIRRKNGDPSVYKYYFASSGYFLIGCHIFVMIVWVVLTEFSTVWMKWWSAANERSPNEKLGMYLGVYIAIGVISTVGACLAAWTAIISIISKSAIKLHSDLLHAVFKAPMQMFAAAEGGEILNRFSQDMQLVDMDLPSTLVNYSSTAFACITKVIIIAVSSRYMGITIPFIGIFLFFLQRFYLQTSRQIRLISIEAKAPLYGSFTSMAEGLVTIRAFGWQRQYEERCQQLVDTSQRPEYMLSCVQHCLGFVLGIVTTIIAVVLVAITVNLPNQTDAGSVGVSLVMVVGFSEVLVRLIKSWTSLETSVGAVARIKRFVADTASEEPEGNGKAPPPDWPTAGGVEIKSLTASYGDLPPVLKDFTLSVAPGQHVAICGRTGSGKSSLILSLQQMISMTPDSTIAIDGVDISLLSRQEHRMRLNVVSQDPFLFPGTFRLNLDPFSCASDDTIVKALKKVQLWDSVEAKGGLDVDLDKQLWSAGERQLLCFARAIVRKCKILILDEAASSLDTITESVIHDLLVSDFQDCTVISVMHRLHHIRSFDKVAVLEDGVLVEYDDPAILLQKTSRLAELYNVSESDGGEELSGRST